MPRLVVHQGDAPPREIRLCFGTQRFGRRPDNDHCVDDVTVSGAHCEIEVTEAGVRVRDLGSTNGTFIQGAPVTDAWLAVGETLHLGGVACQLVAEDTALVVEAPPQPTARVRMPPESAESDTQPSSVPVSGVCSAHPRGGGRVPVRPMRSGLVPVLCALADGGHAPDGHLPQLRRLLQ